METVVYKTVNGLQIEADVYPGTGHQPAPVLVWIHGGALIMGNRKWQHAALSALFSEAGYAQVALDYRLAPETKLPAIIEDVCDVFRWIRGAGEDLFHLDPRRVAVVGHSGGGYLALMTGFHVKPRPRVLASFYGYGDIAGPWYSEPDPHYCENPPVSAKAAYAAVTGEALATDFGDKRRWPFYLYCRQNGLWPREVVGVDPHKEPDAFTPYCPERNVTADFPPTILLHGTNDTDVPYQRSVDMAAALESAGVPHELVTVADGRHGFDGAVKYDELRGPAPSAAARAMIQAAEFIMRHNEAE